MVNIARIRNGKDSKDNLIVIYIYLPANRSKYNCWDKVGVKVVHTIIIKYWALTFCNSKQIKEHADKEDINYISNTEKFELTICIINSRQISENPKAEII